MAARAKTDPARGAARAGRAGAPRGVGWGGERGGWDEGGGTKVDDTTGETMTWKGYVRGRRRN